MVVGYEMMKATRCCVPCWLSTHLLSMHLRALVGSELHASPHIHIWIGHTHIWIYMDKTIWENALYVG